MTTPPILKAGVKVELGSYQFTADRIMTFARKYDPQIFHIDPELAKHTLFGGLCASGWHTISVWMRCLRQYHRTTPGGEAIEFGPSPGFHDLRWIRPVYAGDRIEYFSETLELRPSASWPRWHVHTVQGSAVNQRDQPVMSFTAAAMVRI